MHRNIPECMFHLVSHFYYLHQVVFNSFSLTESQTVQSFRTFLSQKQYYRDRRHANKQFSISWETKLSCRKDLGIIKTKSIYFNVTVHFTSLSLNSFTLFPGWTSFPSSTTTLRFGPPSPSPCGKRAPHFLKEDQVPTPTAQKDTWLSRQVSGAISALEGLESLAEGTSL